MVGYVFRNSDGSLHFTEYGCHAYKNFEKGKWVLEKGVHAMSINSGALPEVKWEDNRPTKVELLILCD